MRGTQVIGKGKGQGKRNIFLHFAADGDPLGDMPATAACPRPTSLVDCSQVDISFGTNP